MNLLNQPVAFQIGSDRYNLRAPPTIASILEDFDSVVLPKGRSTVLRAHDDAVKVLKFVGTDGTTLGKTRAEATVRLWNVGTRWCTAALLAMRASV